MQWAGWAAMGSGREWLQEGTFPISVGCRYFTPASISMWECRLKGAKSSDFFKINQSLLIFEKQQQIQNTLDQIKSARGFDE